MWAGVLWNDRPCLSRYGQAAAAHGLRRSGKDRQRGMCGGPSFYFFVSTSIYWVQRAERPKQYCCFRP